MWFLGCRQKGERLALDGTNALDYAIRRTWGAWRPDEDALADNLVISLACDRSLLFTSLPDTAATFGEGSVTGVIEVERRPEDCRGYDGVFGESSG
jgi:hypothetical protein